MLDKWFMKHVGYNASDVFIAAMVAVSVIPFALLVMAFTLEVLRK